jgi:hypothetical protein
MKCPGCKSDIDIPLYSLNKCRTCGYVYKTSQDNYLTNKILDNTEDLGPLEVGEHVCISNTESVWNGEQGIIIAKLHKYYNIQLVREGTKTSTIVKFPHNFVKIRS